MNTEIFALAFFTLFQIIYMAYRLYVKRVFKNDPNFNKIFHEKIKIIGTIIECLGIAYVVYSAYFQTNNYIAYIDCKGK